MEEQELIIGRNSVREAIRAGRSVEAIYVSARGEGSIREILALARKMELSSRKFPKQSWMNCLCPMGTRAIRATIRGLQRG